MISSKLKELTDDNFQSEVIDNGGVVVIDYYAEWCSPCHAIAIAMEELNNEYAGSLRIVKGNIDANGATLSKFGVTGIPAILIFKEGKLVYQYVGTRSKKDIKKDIDEVYKT